MKIDYKILALIGGGIYAYFVLRKKKPGIQGGTCASTYGPKLDYVDKDGNCILKKESDAIGLFENFPKSQADCPPNHRYRAIMTSQFPTTGGLPGKCYPIRSQADCPPNTQFEMQAGGAPIGRCTPIADY